MADRLAARLADPRLGWGLLALGMVAASAAILHAGRGLSFAADDLYAFARLIDGPEGPVVHALGLEYMIGPHNGHLQLGGKLVYEPLLAIFGADYTPLRVAGLLGVLAGVGLAFELARPRVGVPVALALALAILLCGAAWEVMLWPFDLHTTYALAFGLAALLVLDRGGRRADPVACALLVAAISMIEVGLSFVLAVAALFLLRRELRRLWVVAVPLVLYAAWWLWAQRFEHESTELANLVDVPGSLVDSLVAVSAALTGAYAHGPGVFPWNLEPTAIAAVVAGLVAVGLAVGVWRAASPFAGALGAALLSYWGLIGLAARPEDSSRYVWVGAILLVLLGAELARGAGLRGTRGLAVAAGVLLVTAIAFPAGREKLQDGRTQQLSDAQRGAAYYAMVELADSAVGLPRAEVGAVTEFERLGRLPAGAYLAAKERIGSLAAPLSQIPELDAEHRQLADIALVRALGIEPVPASAPDGGACARSAPGQETRLPRGGALIMARGETELALSRYAAPAPSISVGTLDPGWSELRTPPDGEPQPWMAIAGDPVRICPLD